MQYRRINKVIQAQRLSEKNGHLVTVWHKVCMSNGFTLSQIVNIQKKMLNLKEGQEVTI